MDQMLDTETAAAWLNIAPRQLQEYPRIPVFKFNQRVIRYCPRAILAQLCDEWGMKPHVIAAMLHLDLNTLFPKEDLKNDKTNQSHDKN